MWQFNIQVQNDDTNEESVNELFTKNFKKSHEIKTH